MLALLIMITNRLRLEESETISGRVYAAYVLGRVGDFTAPSSLSQWLEEAPGGEEWATSAAGFVLSRLGGK